MRYEVPSRPIPEKQQRRKESLSFLLVLFICAFSMVSVSVALLDGFLEKLFGLLAAYFSYWIASTISGNIREKHERISNAWLSYWADYWEEERLLRIEIDRLPDSSEDKQLLELKLSRMRDHYNRYYCSNDAAEVASSDRFDQSKYRNKFKKSVRFDLSIFVPVILIAIFLVGHVIIPKLDLSNFYPESSNAKPAPTLSTSSQSSILQYYQHNYPQTWGYISKHAEDPFNYLQYYHSVWGRLQEYHGDGIPFGTLTAFEQMLVSYPPIKSYIYLAVGQTTYHSTPDCYTLLRSDVYAEPAKYFSFYDPCSKCVGE